MMRLGLGIVAGVATNAALAIWLAAPAAAWDRDLVYADSFGNLVIESAAGYKRIVVGEGHEARRLAGYMGAEEPQGEYRERAEQIVSDECYRPPVLVKGRSYMYGFDQGVIPLRGGPCR